MTPNAKFAFTEYLGSPSAMHGAFSVFLIVMLIGFLIVVVTKNQNEYTDQKIDVGDVLGNIVAMLILVLIVYALFH